MTETPFEDDVVDDVPDPSDTDGPRFDQVEREWQDNDNDEIIVPDVEEDDV
jgi:hypothetical protein